MDEQWLLGLLQALHNLPIFFTPKEAHIGFEVHTAIVMKNSVLGYNIV
jgi:hypothetical protein